MSEPMVRKPSYDEWLHWAQVVSDRLTTIVHVYNKPPFDDAFIPEHERQLKVALIVEILRHIHTLTDEHEEQASRKLAAEEHYAEHVITDLRKHIDNVLQHLPALAEDMQKLLKSTWFNDFSGKVAKALFLGPEGRETDGIGSGMAENGRLPEVLHALLEREDIGGARQTREIPDSGIQKLRRDDLQRLWGKRSSSFLRSAGRVD